VLNTQEVIKIDDKMRLASLSALILGVLLLTSVANTCAQEEQANVNARLKLQSDGNFTFTASVDATMPREELEQPPTLSQIPSADVLVEISSPTPGQLQINLSGKAVLSEAAIAELPENLKMFLGLASAEMINSYIEIAGIEGKPLSEIFGGNQALPYGKGISMSPGIGDEIILENVNCTEFSWEEPTLAVGFNVLLSSSGFENEEWCASLPATITASLKGSEDSLNFSIDGSSATAESSLELSLTVADNLVNMDMSITVQGELHVGEDGSYTFQLPPEIQKSLSQEDLVRTMEGVNLTFALEVPEDAEVTGLPGNPEYADGTYTWSGASATEAVEALLEGQFAPQVNFSGTGAGEEGLPWIWIGTGIAAIVAVVATIAIIGRCR